MHQSSLKPSLTSSQYHGLHQKSNSPNRDFEEGNKYGDSIKLMTAEQPRKW